MRTMTIALSLIVALHSLGCGAPAWDPTPAARVGNDVITRGFVHAAMASLSQKRGAAAERQTLEAIVRDTLVACKAREEGMDRVAGVAGAMRRAAEGVRRGYLCERGGVDGDACVSWLHERLRKDHGLAVPTIDWERLSPTPRRPFIPLGGTIPSTETGKSKPDELDMHYASSISITAADLRCSLADCITSLDDPERDRLRDVETRERALRAALVDRFAPLFLKTMAPAERVALGELERRAADTVLVKAYRQAIGFESVSGGRSRARVYPVTAAEARRFYQENQNLFQEPVSVELSHIRVRDAATAAEMHRRLVENPALFCELARRHSIAPDAGQCGRIGAVRRDRRLPLALEFGFTLTTAGQISVPFATPEGVEILRLDRRTVRLRAFDDPYTRTLIAEKMQPVKREAQLRADIEAMKKRYPVRYGP